VEPRNSTENPTRVGLAPCAAGQYSVLQKIFWTSWRFHRKLRVDRPDPTAEPESAAMTPAFDPPLQGVARIPFFRR
jgi:hypothetical protein